MPQRLPRPARRALVAIRVGVVGSIVVAGWATQGIASGPGSGYARYAVTDEPSPVRRVLDRHDCSVTGFASGAQPASAIIRTAAGRLRFVSFDSGWRVFTHHGWATLVAVCLDEPPSRLPPGTPATRMLPARRSCRGSVSFVGGPDGPTGQDRPCRPSPDANRCAPSRAPDSSETSPCRSSLAIASASVSPSCSSNESRSWRRHSCGSAAS